MSVEEDLKQLENIRREGELTEMKRECFDMKLDAKKHILKREVLCDSFKLRH